MGAYFIADAYLRAVALVVLAATAGPLIAGTLGLLEKLTLEALLKYAGAASLCALIVLGAYASVGELLKNKPALFPRRDGVLADFGGSPGSPARSGSGTQISLFSDSTQNMRSVARYERVDHETRNGDGYLRVFYQLESTDSRQPFVGVYWDLTFPPPEALNAAGFGSLSSRLRTGQKWSDSQIGVSLILHSANVRNPEYAFPRFLVAKHELTRDWVDLHWRLTEYVQPDFYGGGVEFDPTRLYRVGILITGPPGRATHGHIDIDFVRLGELVPKH